MKADVATGDETVTLILNDEIYYLWCDEKLENISTVDSLMAAIPCHGAIKHKRNSVLSYIITTIMLYIGERRNVFLY